MNYQRLSKSSFQGSFLQSHCCSCFFNLGSIQYSLLHNIIENFHFYGSSLGHLNRYYILNVNTSNPNFEWFMRSAQNSIIVFLELFDPDFASVTSYCLYSLLYYLHLNFRHFLKIVDWTRMINYWNSRLANFRFVLLFFALQWMDPRLHFNLATISLYFQFLFNWIIIGIFFRCSIDWKNWSFNLKMIFFCHLYFIFYLVLSLGWNFKFKLFSSLWETDLIRLNY